MWTYWLMFFLSALAALSARRHLATNAAGVRSVQLDGAWIAAVIVLSLLIGFRIEVGADWFNYVRYVYDARYAPFGSIFQGNDPGYQFLNWLSATALMA